MTIIRRNRAKKPINQNALDGTFTDLSEIHGERISSSALSAKSRAWRKLCSYLNFPRDSAQYLEAIAALNTARIDFEDGQFNSRTFFKKD